MDLGGEFCLVCGAKPPLYLDRMCEKCTRARVKLVEIPETIQHFRCARCDLIEVGGRWVKIPPDELHEDLVNRAMKVHQAATAIRIELAPEQVDERNIRLHLSVSGDINGLDYEEEHTLWARLSNGVCQTCARKAGNYYEATVQLRSAGRKLSKDELDELRASLDKVISEMTPDPMFFVNNEGPVQGGYDVVLGSKGLARTWARHMLKHWGGQCKETNTVAGRKDGSDLTRLTLLYRKPGYGVGDLVRWRESLWRLSGWTGEGALLTRIDRNERTGGSWRDLEKLTVMAPHKEQHEVELITQDSSAGEFLNPRDWKPITVRLPHAHTGSSLRVACVEGEWMALPHLSIDDRGDE